MSKGNLITLLALEDLANPSLIVASQAVGIESHTLPTNQAFARSKVSNPLSFNLFGLFHFKSTHESDIFKPGPSVLN
jgi:hypothetical protein